MAFLNLMQNRLKPKEVNEALLNGGSSLPDVTTEDNGDVLTVVEGDWAKAELPKELPAVTSSDNGDVLTVVEGVWAKHTPSTPTVPTILHGTQSVPEMGPSYTYTNLTITFGVTLPSSNYDILLSFAQHGDAGQPGSQNMNYIISNKSATGFWVSVSSDGTSPAGVLTWTIIQNQPAVQSKRTKKETNK